MTPVADRPLTIWERVLAPDEGAMSADDARYLLRLDFSPADHARMAELGGRAAERPLAPDEAAELDDYLRVGHQLARLQSAARRALRQAGGD
jgi:hypothetical protein